MKNIVSHICGGLGNQIFQYAAGRALSLRLKTPMKLNTSWFINIASGCIIRTFELLSFPNIQKTISKIDTKTPGPLETKALPWIRFLRDQLGVPIFLLPRIVPEPSFAYWPDIKKISFPVALHGYWQSEKYFSEFSTQLHEDLIFPPLPRRAQAIAQRIQTCSNAVSVHIRRGDYMNNAQTQAFHGLTGQDYYTNALKHMDNQCGKSELFLFSDDPRWVKENFDSHGHNATIVDLQSPDAPHHDMHLMSLCRHHIIANSSFSWWGAWLGNDTGLTIAPKRWFADTNVDTSDIIPDRWLQL